MLSPLYGLRGMRETTPLFYLCMCTQSKRQSFHLSLFPFFSFGQTLVKETTGNHLKNYAILKKKEAEK
jgi:hypothetical protein